MFIFFFCARAQSGLWGNNSDYNSDDTIGDDYGEGDMRNAKWQGSFKCV